MAERNTISAEGMAKAEEELRHLREERRPEIVAAIKTAREFGDLKENAEYHAAREEQSHNEARIRVLEHHLSSVEVSERAGDGSVAAGATVRYRDLAADKVVEATLVHPLEADLGAGKLSVESPVAQGLLGARAGDTVTLTTPRGEKQVEVLEVG